MVYCFVIYIVYPLNLILPDQTKICLIVSEKILMIFKYYKQQNKTVINEFCIITDKYIVALTTWFLYLFALQFKADRAIQKNDGLYRENPTISEKMHCVLFVVNADKLYKEREYSTLTHIKHYLAEKSTWLLTIYV